ncbi:MAG TPA: hypothetical protein IAC82_09365 [Candidatus Merdivicinus intestinigallinarum]|nr:hypothetical protein [Candidatus Merdivicinus intestinigallinarum]
MENFRQHLMKNLSSGRISEIMEIAERYYGQRAGSLPPEEKADILCSAMCITREDLDSVISGHSEVARTIKGHAFEVVFDSMMAANEIQCVEVGGDTDIDRVVNGHTLQLKTPYAKGCSEGIVSYKPHKTHGAKSGRESVGYYHRVCDFADYLVGLVSYDPFTVLIVPRESLPRVHEYSEYIQSPMYLKTDSCWTNQYWQLGIEKNMEFPGKLLSPGENECLPKSSSLMGLKSDYILRAIFIKDNFRIWDMNLRGFIREHVLFKMLEENRIQVYPPTVTGRKRPDKCDAALKTRGGRYVGFQVKGLTWSGTVFKGADTAIDCETQLSRGRVNDHPTQSRLYLDTDFECLIIAVDPPYSNTLSMHTFNRPDYRWNFYCVPMPRLRKHPDYPNRVSSHQYIPYRELQKYRIGPSWMETWMPERL